MIAVFDGAEAGSAKASWLFMARSYTGQVWVRNPTGQNRSHFSRLSSVGPENRTGIGPHPRDAKTSIPATKTGYVRRSV
ncbi:MAG: hypothetical protein WBE92_18810, partial [Steroidobacteraceae bacterium]